MEWLEISIEDLMNIGMKNDVAEWKYLYETCGVDKSTIRKILALTDKEYGLSTLEEFDDAVDSLHNE